MKILRLQLTNSQDRITVGGKSMNVVVHGEAYRITPHGPDYLIREAGAGGVFVLVPRAVAIVTLSEAPTTEEEVWLCDECHFEAKSPAGLKAHTSAKMCRTIAREAAEARGAVQKRHTEAGPA